MDGTQSRDATLSREVQSILNDQFSDRIYSVEDGLVWVSGMNQHCGSVARQMADSIVQEDIPCSLVRDDDATRFGGVQFRYGANA